MKKILTAASISCILVLLMSISLMTNKNINLPDTEVQIIPHNSQFKSKESNEQTYYGLFITLLYPYIEKAIGNYYSEYLTYLPSEAPNFYKFTSIKKTPGLNYSYTIELEVQPYVGPHLSVGRDRITFKIDLDGVKFEKFEHIESYELPPYYQDIIKKKLP